MTENVPARAATPDADAVTYPVSYAQESLLAGVYESAITVPAVARVGADVPPPRLQRALDVLVARHAALRTVFVRSDGGAVVGHVRPAGALPLTVTEHRTRPADLLARVLLAGAEQPFVLAGGAGGPGRAAPGRLGRRAGRGLAAPRDLGPGLGAGAGR